MTRVRNALRRFSADQSGLALLEFALVIPIFLVMSLTGAEVTNYIVTRMRISQVALHLADNSARIGTGSQLAAKTITETDINDLLTGSGLQAGELDLYNRGRVVIYDIEPKANPNTTNKFKIGWQRCRGTKTSYTPSYGIAGQSSGIDKDGYGPTSQQITAQDYGATMLVEVFYDYQPLIKTSLSPETTIHETASMMVRDRRDLSTGPGHLQGIYNTENATVSTC